MGQLLRLLEGMLWILIEEGGKGKNNSTNFCMCEKYLMDKRLIMFALEILFCKQISSLVHISLGAMHEVWQCLTDSCAYLKSALLPEVTPCANPFSS